MSTNSTGNKSTAQSGSRAGEGVQGARILVLHGPNLNLLGRREPEIYGRATLADIHASMEAQARACGVQVESFQSNSEGELIDRIQAAASEGIEFIIIHPGAYSHTSIAIPDALRGVAIPYIEVHISNIHAREAFRHYSYFSAGAAGVICGFGIQGYELALDAALARIRQT
jgi:3-dehydroquinate dehydratase-2